MILTRHTAIVVFSLALALRLAYLGFVAQDQSNLHAPDSVAYNGLAEDMLSSGGFNHRVGPGGAFVPETERVPMYVAYLAAVRALFGPNPVWPVAGQCLFDAVTCVGIGMLAARFRADLFLLAGVCAAVNLNLIVHSALILSDSLFLLPFTLMLLCTVRFIQRPTLSDALLVGCSAALALLTRSMLIYFVPLLLLTMLLAARHHALHLSRVSRYTAAFVLPLVMLVGPLILRNNSTYGYYGLVSQGGTHALFWVVPLAREFSRGVPMVLTQDEMRRELAVHLSDRGANKVPENPFESSKLHITVALRALRDMTISELVLAWAAGAGINLFAPSVASVPYISHLDRPKFYETPGDTPIGKIWNVLRQSKGISYLSWIISAGLMTLLFRCLQLWGIRCLVKVENSEAGPMLFLLVVTAYVFLITGPIVGVKYRLPIEPILIVFTAAGFHSILMSHRGSVLRALIHR